MEIWKDIQGYEGLYQVSNYGRIKSIHKNKENGIILQGYSRGNKKQDYLRVNLCKDNSQKWFSIHRLVAKAFIPNPNNKPQVNHKDGDKQNNNVKNLEWCTNKENCIHALKNGLFHKQTNKPIVQLTLKGDFVKRWDTLIEIQDVLKIDKRLVHNCCKHISNRQSSKGFIWKYEEEYINE